MGITAGKVGIDITNMSEKDKLKLRRSYSKLVRDEIIRARIIADPDVLSSMVDDPQINATMREQLKGERWPVKDKPAEVVETDVVRKFGK